MRILVTRPEPDAAIQAELLEKRGHSVVVSPMLDIEMCTPKHFDIASTTAIIATSRNALRAIADHPDLAALTNKPIFVVGPKTADAARALGFQSVITGPSTAADLVPLIAKKIPSSSQSAHMLYLAPEQPAFDLIKALESTELSINHQVVYRTNPATKLTASARRAILGGNIDAAIIMSARTAATFAALVMANGLQKQVGEIVLLCLSEPVAEALRVLNPPVVEIAIRPRTEEMLALVDRLAAKSG